MLRRLKDSLDAKTKARLLDALYQPFRLRDWVFAALYGLGSIHGWRLHGVPRIQMSERGSIRIGHNFTAVSRWKRNTIGVSHPVLLKAVRPGSKIRIGSNVGLSGCTLSASISIKVGDDVMIGSGALITDSDAHPLGYEARMRDEAPRMSPVTIENGAFIGARSVILKGVTIGRCSVVGAGSVVSRDVPAGVIVAGNPARVVKDLSR